MTKPDLKKKFYITVAATLALLTALGVFIVFPRLSRLAALSEELVNTKQTLAEVIQRREDLEVLKRDYSTKEDDIARIRNAFVSDVNELEFIRFIERTAKISGHERAYTLSNPVEESSANGERIALQLSLTLTGSFKNLELFLYLLENGPYLIDVESVTIDRVGILVGAAEGAPAVPQLRTVISFVAYTR